MTQLLTARPRTDTRNTGVLVVFTALTNLADGVLKVALPLVATTLTTSPGMIAAVATVLTLPWLLTSLHVGVLVDRFDRRALLLAANLVRVATMAGTAVALLTGALSLPLLYAAAALMGVAEVVATTASVALVPSAVTPPGREQANAWMAGAETACGEFTGPFVGGVLVAVGAGLALGVTGAAYVVGMLVLLFLVGRFAPNPGGERPVGSVHGRIGEGLAYLWRQPMLRGMALLLTVLCACWGAWLALMPLVATDLLDLSAAEYGALMSALGAGGIVGALTVGWVNRLLGRRWAMFADLLGTAAMMAAPVLSSNVWVVGAAAFLGGMGGTLWAVNTRTITQRMVTGAMLGRFSAVFRLFGWGAMPLGAALVGVLAEVVGVRAAFGVFAVAALLAVVPFLRVVTPAALAAVPRH
ncbi:MFS transporter [Nocardiopsis sp. L17-MgMaSL7]|uniref:MFS transporter n=1 Tax=Nocardiopsis sp. L17-MgMaSL7 TaxID=1938893 RepID=UPI000D70EB20|nr:MFS transporter [Nocardiopsis sp. L17-MgMaSL7]PWV46757.1 putative MFS family arabinose efflux permease [Nocardiopsis sp. L17-MgMaSL7]